MSEQTDSVIGAPSDKRTIKPWIAGLLTILGWGVGLYYARRTKAAILMSITATITSILVGAAVITYLYQNSPVSTASGLLAQNVRDSISLLMALPVAICVWVYVAKLPRQVNKSGPIRLVGYIFIWVAPIVVSVAFALLIRFFFVQPFHIPAASMTPTIEKDSYFLVEKYAYGYNKHSFVPFDGILPDGFVKKKAPERGDVVIFRNRNDNLQTYVKRLIGMPGDEIRFIEGRLHINNVVVSREQTEVSKLNCRFAGGGGAYSVSGGGAAYIETLPNGVAYKIQECAGDFGSLDNVGPYRVPSGHYFMLGDNRDESQDSRIISAVGYIPSEHIIGRARLPRVYELAE